MATNRNALSILESLFSDVKRRKSKTPLPSGFVTPRGGEGASAGAGVAKALTDSQELQRLLALKMPRDAHVQAWQRRVRAAGVLQRRGWGCTSGLVWMLHFGLLWAWASQAIPGVI